LRGLEQEREDSGYEKENDDTQRITPEQRSGGFDGRCPTRERRTKWMQLEESIIYSAEQLAGTICPRAFGKFFASG